MRKFDGKLNETQDQALNYFESKHGFKPLTLKSQTPGLANQSTLKAYFANMAAQELQKQNELAGIEDSGDSKGDKDYEGAAGDDKQPKKAQTPANGKESEERLNSEETSLLNSSYADFHEVFKNLKRR